jgi:hypothetical protein
MLIAVGYWVEDDDGEFGRSLPNPRDLVGADYGPELVARISRYLESGATFMSWMGYSHCRFACGVGGVPGCRDLSDGIWVWPEGLPHYVAAHNVTLPDEFLKAMERAQWSVPSEVTLPAIRTGERIPVDYGPWISWSVRRRTG